MKERVNADGEIVVRQDAHGHEILDPTPVAIPAGFKRPETLAEQVARLVRSERWKQDMEAAGVETFEESEDFDVDDEFFDPSTPYEEVFDPVLRKGITPDEMKRNGEVYRERYKKELKQEADEHVMRVEARRRRWRDFFKPSKESAPPAPKQQGGAPDSTST